MQCGERAFVDVPESDVFYAQLGYLVGNKQFLDAHELNKAYILRALNCMIASYRQAPGTLDLARTQKLALASILEKIKEAYEHKIIEFLQQTSWKDNAAKTLYLFTRKVDGWVDALCHHATSDGVMATLEEREKLFKQTLTDIQSSEV